MEFVEDGEEVADGTNRQEGKRVWGVAEIDSSCGAEKQSCLDFQERDSSALESLCDEAVVVRGALGSVRQAGVEVKDRADEGSMGRGFSGWTLGPGVFCVRHFPARFRVRDSFFPRGG